MTKSELVKQISYSTGIDYATALTVVEAFMSEVKSSLADQEPVYLTYIIHSGFISGYQNRYGDNLKPPTNVYHRMTA